MAILPQRFVPTVNTSIHADHIVIQTGHSGSVTAAKFSPCLKYFASADADGWLKIWVVDTLDILINRFLGFACHKIDWIENHTLKCTGNEKISLVELPYENDGGEAYNLSPEPDASRIIRLLGSPEAVCDDNILRVSYQEQTFEYGIPALQEAVIEPCERYVVARSPQKLVVASAFEQNILISVDAPKNFTWLGFKIDKRGDNVFALCNDGSIWLINANARSASQIHRLHTEIRTFDFGDDTLLLVGDVLGCLAIFDLRSHTLMLKTPRECLNFISAIPSPEKLGFIALRPNSATAYLTPSHEILSAAPLPSAAVSACAGQRYSEILVACEDSAVYRMKLDENTITKLFITTDPAKSLACAGNAVAFITKNGQLGANIGSRTVFRGEAAPSAKTLAINEDASRIIILHDSKIEILTLSPDSRPKISKIDADSPSLAIFCAKDKNRAYILSQNMTLCALDTDACTLLPISDPLPECAFPISLAPASANSFFALFKDTNGHDAICRFSNKAAPCVLMRIMAQGRQIWAAEEDNRLMIRDDATPLRVCENFKSTGVEDWLRSEPLNANE